MRHYETIYIINPNISDDDYQSVIEKFNKSIEQQKGVIIKTKEWGKQRLAYEIKKFDRGSYIHMVYCGDAGTVLELERIMKLDDRILKFQTVKLADNADPQVLLQQEKESQQVSEKTDTPEDQETAEGSESEEQEP